ncbi:MAG: carboxypeptidase regulatory-like domain-containing protein [Bacteroidota bacterium]
MILGLHTFSFVFLAFCLQQSPSPSFSDTIHIESPQTIQGVLTGSVTLPATSNTRRSFRGAAYRGRGRSGSKKASGDAAMPELLNVVISAHPTSFSIDAEPLDPVQIKQRDAEFIPKVTPVTVGTIVQFVNNDPFYHNVFSITPGAKFNIGRRPTGDVVDKKIPELKWKVTGLGPISLFCDIHNEMNAVILSLETPYFVKPGEDGTYRFDSLPDGTYDIRVYHPRFEVASQSITISSGSTIQQNFTLQSR